MNSCDICNDFRYEEIVLNNSSPSQLEIIQQILQQSPHSTIFHAIEWNQIVEQFIKKNCIYGIAFDGERPVGLIYFYLDIRKQNLESPHYSPFDSLYGGSIVIADYPINVASFLLNTINRKYRSFSRFVRMSPLIEDAKSLVSKGDSQMLTSLIDLTIGKEIFWKNLKKNVRRDIRLAQRRGVKVIEGKREHIIPYYQMRSKTLAEEHSNDQIEVSLFEEFLKFGLEKKILRFLVAIYEGNIVAGAVFGIWNRRIYYHSSAFDRNFRELCPNDLVQWEQIEWGINNGYEIYDMCHIEPQRYPGIAKFKMKFGGRISPFYIITRKNLKDNLFSKVNKLKKLLGCIHDRE